MYYLDRPTCRVIGAIVGGLAGFLIGLAAAPWILGMVR